jgi:hypothetical protein
VGVIKQILEDKFDPIVGAGLSMIVSVYIFQFSFAGDVRESRAGYTLPIPIKNKFVYWEI